MIYVFQVVLYSAILWVFYLLLLRDRPMHAFNRAYLLLTSALPIILPFISLPQSDSLETYRQEYLNVRLPEITITDNDLASNTLTLGTWLLVSYVIVTLLVLSFHARQLWQMSRVIRNSEKRREDGYTMLLNTGYGPGSWGKYIFLPEGDIDDRVLQHELAHIQLHHTRDTLWMMLLQSFFWFNPFLHLVRKELRIIHEYQADALAADKADYGNLLLAHALDTCTLPLAHSFFHHPIKRRIMMLNKKLRNSTAIMRSSIVADCSILFIVSAVAVQSCKEKEFEVSKTDDSNMPKIQKGEGAIFEADINSDPILVTKITTDGDTVQLQEMKDTEIVTTAAKNPEFPGGQAGLTNYLTTNLKYPAEAQKAKIQGRVTVRFYVDKNGKPSSPYILSSPNPLLSSAAIDVIERMPDWTPGEDEGGEKVAVWYILPVSFKL